MGNPAESMFSPYRDENIEKTLTDMIEDDLSYYCSNMETRGLWFMLGFLCVLILSLSKALIMYFKNLSKPKFNPRNIEINREGVNSVERGTPFNSTVQLREKYDSLDDTYYNNRIAKEGRTKNLNTLRLYLYNAGLILKGKIIKTTNHKISDYDLIKCAETGKITKSFSTTQITFGNDLDSLLSQIFPDYITLRKKKFSDDTYVIFDLDDYGFLEEKLRKLYQEDIKVMYI